MLEFDRDRKSMSVLVSPQASADSLSTTANGKLMVKGAPESVIERCSHQRLANGTDVPLTAASRKRIMAKVLPN
ncbi:hypothetical protein T492DRAFT_860657 [Pavlovales sp. CCMP2436]|nr:hypothetical protein T492DRAFT_860657 [Pavlovales sp. CCMP2436]